MEKLHLSNRENFSSILETLKNELPYLDALLERLNDDRKTLLNKLNRQERIGKTRRKDLEELTKRIRSITEEIRLLTKIQSSLLRAIEIYEPSSTLAPKTKEIFVSLLAEIIKALVIAPFTEREEASKSFIEYVVSLLRNFTMF